MDLDMLTSCHRTKVRRTQKNLCRQITDMITPITDLGFRAKNGRYLFISLLKFKYLHLWTK